MSYNNKESKTATFWSHPTHRWRHTFNHAWTQIKKIYMTGPNWDCKDDSKYQKWLDQTLYTVDHILFDIYFLNKNIFAYEKPFLSILWQSI